MTARPEAIPDRRNAFYSIAFIALAALASVGVSAQEGPSAAAPSSSPRDFVQIGDHVYFTADDGVNGRELWLYEANGKCTLAFDCIAGPKGGHPVSRMAAGEYLYLTARNESGGVDLWQWNDREQHGRLLHTTAPHEGDIQPRIHGGLLDGRAFLVTLRETTGAWNVYVIDEDRPTPQRLTSFSVADKVTASYEGAVIADGNDLFVVNGALWHSNGTPEGTVRVTQVESSRTCTTWTQPLGPRLVFLLEDRDHGLEPWSTDGATNTVLLRDIRPGPQTSAIAQKGVMGDRLFFGADDGETGLELWYTDGTSDGTRLVLDINPGRGSSDPHYFVPAGGVMYFAADDGQHGVELWCSDGTPQGTRLVRDIDRSLPSSAPYHLAAVGNAVFFGATAPPYGDSLWTSDGTAEGTRMLADLVPGSRPGGPAHLTPFGDQLLLAYTEPLHGEELWICNPATGQLSLVADINVPRLNPSTSPAQLTAMGDAVYFVAPDLEHGEELWVSRGRDETTTLLRDIAPGPIDSHPQHLTPGADTLWFTATAPETGRELWCSNGTTEGTCLGADIWAGPGSSEPRDLVTVDKGLYFTAQDDKTGRAVWFADGTSNAAQKAWTPAQASVTVVRLVSFRGQAYLYVRNSDKPGLSLYQLGSRDGADELVVELPAGYPRTTGNQLIEPDATIASIVPWVCPALPDGGARPVSVGDWTYFVAHTPHYGAELWRVGGTAQSVSLVCDAFPGRAGSSPKSLTAFQGRLYFIAEHPNFGQVLWSTDGTALGTEVVRPMLGDSTLPPLPALDLAVVKGNLIALSRAPSNAVDFNSPPGLYALHASATQTVFENLTPLDATGNLIGIKQLTGCESRVFFTADDGVHGEELWTLGTDLLAQLVKDILVPGNLTPLRD